MRIARQAVAVDLESKVVEVLLVESTLEVGAGVDPGRGVALYIDMVAAAGSALSPEEMVVPDLVECGRRGEGREVAADALLTVVRLHHHHGRVPPDESAYPPFDVLITGELWLLLEGDRVDVRRRDRSGNTEAGLVGALEQFRKEVAGPNRAVFLRYGIERLDPLPRLDGIGVVELVDVLVANRLAQVGRHGTRLVMH